MIVNNDNAYITLNSQDILFIILQNLILGYAVTKIFIQSLNSFPLITIIQICPNVVPTTHFL